MPEVKPKESEEEEVFEKPKKKPWWETISPLYIIGGALIIFFALNSMMQEDANKNQQFLIILIVLGVLAFLAKTDRPTESYVTPKEAELIVEYEMRRKVAWGQFPLMTTFKVGPVGDLIHRDARGMYYAIGVEVQEPYGLPKYYVASVMIAGPERAFTTFQEALVPFNGREIRQEKTIMPEWMRRSKDYPLLEKLFGRYGGF